MPTGPSLSTRPTLSPVVHVLEPEPQPSSRSTMGTISTSFSPHLPGEGMSHVTANEFVHLLAASVLEIQKLLQRFKSSGLFFDIYNTLSVTVSEHSHQLMLSDARD